MSTASPTAFLLWAILSVLFLGFLTYHLWSYDRFKCLLWSSGRQPGAFKRVMTYSYLGSVPLFVVYSVAFTVIKFREGYIVVPDDRIIPKPLDQYSRHTKNWIVPLDFVFSFAWALELVTHLEELAFWLYLLHQNPQKEEWFNSWEYRLWYMGSIIAMLGMPLTALVARHNVDTCDAWIFLVGSSGATGTTLCFLYVLWRFPNFIRHVKAEGAEPSVVVRLATFYQLNLSRVLFRFLFTIPLFIIAIDGILGTSHTINRNLFWSDFLAMIAGIGCFVSSAITLLIFFPRSIVKEAGYKPKPATTVNSPKSPAITPPGLPSGPLALSSHSHYQTTHEGEDWDEAPLPDDTSLYYAQAPPYAGMSMAMEAQQDDLTYRHPDQGPYQRQPFPHAISSPQILAPPLSPPTSPQQTRVALPPRHSRRMSGIGRASPVDVHRAGTGLGLAMSPSIGSASTIDLKRVSAVQAIHDHHQRITGSGQAYDPMYGVTPSRSQQRALRPTSTLHPYVMTFTSPIDLADLSGPMPDDLPRTM